MKRVIGGLLLGMVFGLGLFISRMTDPNRVLAFLTGSDLRLMAVMAGASSVYALGYRWYLKSRGGALLAPRGVDRRLLIGAGLFGTGWGLSGFCPGPALTAAGAGQGGALVFVVGLVGGTLLSRAFLAWLAKEPKMEIAAGADAKPTAPGHSS